MNYKENNKKISIIIPVYNAEEFLGECLDCLLNQSYKNLEIIIVNDGSKGNCKEIAEKYKKIDERVKYVEHEKNKGLFQARVTGVKNSTGDYIAFLDSDDKVSNDYYRELIDKAEETNSDIVASKLVMDFADNNKVIYNLFDFQFEELNGEECLEEYFKQEGLNFAWHISHNKIYSKRIWDRALIDYAKNTEHLVMTEDFSFSTVLFYYAKKVTKVDRVAMFYNKHEGASTSVSHMTLQKVTKNLTDLRTSFSFVENFLKEKKVYEKYKECFEKWRALYCQMHKGYIKNEKFSSEERAKIDKLFEEFCPKQMKISNPDFFSCAQTEWNNGLEELKAKLMNPAIRVVSFDIFDTLITRPFLRPTDLFICLNNDYREMTKNIGIDFSKIREDCEVLARTKAHKLKKEEITLDEIYEVIKEEYNISDEIIEKLKQKEIDLELKYCKRRETAYSIYKLAKYLGKRVICTSDMYLPIDIIRKIIEGNGFFVDKIYLSDEIMKTKGTGTLYNYVLEQEKINAKEMVHIGDNYKTDYENSKEKGIIGIYFPKTTDLMLDRNHTNNLVQMFSRSMPFWRDNQASMNFIGIRTMIAVVANKYFDNPFRCFNRNSDFNIDPYLIGYYILGMYMFGVVNWLLRETQNKDYDSLVFMARDGFLPMEIYNMMKKYYKNVPEAKYVRVSRKALIPAMIINEIDLYKLIDVVNITNHSAKDLLKYIKDCVRNYTDEELENIMTKNNIDINANIKTKQNFNKIIKVIIEELFDKEKNEKKNIKLREYFSNIYNGKSATFDIGYSGRPEVYLSVLCNKPIDTFFLNINQDETLKYAEAAKYKLKTFFDGKPSVTGFAYESMLSELAPSCIGYDIENEVKPILEKDNKSYQERYVISTMQEAAKEFIRDMLNIFGEAYKKLYYQDYYISLPIMAYINSSKPLDMLVFNSIEFEDTVRYNRIVTLTEEWMKERGFRNQRTMNELISRNYSDSGYINVGYLDYNAYPDLEHHSKPVRFIYYMLYDRITFKRRMREIFNNHKILLKIGKSSYSLARKTKNVLYKGVYKIKGGHNGEK